MTAEQSIVLRYLRRYHRRHGYAPSTREIAAGVSLPETTVRRRLGELHAAGKIVRGPFARAITIVRRAS